MTLESESCDLRLYKASSREAIAKSRGVVDITGNNSTTTGSDTTDNG